MKKIIFLVVLAAVLVVPAWAAVQIKFTMAQIYQNGEWIDTDRFIIGYEVNDSDPCVRAFALDVQLKPHDGSDPQFKDYNEATLSADYWVYPGTIDINEAGEINDVGIPIAEPNIRPIDTLPGLDSNGVTFEMGSLYTGEANAPDFFGALIEFVVNDDCNIVITENVSRGGVVVEGLADVNVYMPQEASLRIAPKDPTTATQWRAVGRPKCWLRFENPRQCHGDADGAAYGKGNWWVSANDQIVVNAAWQLPYADLVDPNGSHTRVFVSGVGNVPLICADFDHTSYGKANWRVAVNDQTIVNNYWQQNNAPAADCDP